ncbi:ABC transporter permease [Aquincola sp. MAHUQ-54]|uniref:ABC transporter permease n=1 Tax=Aquincola agrisoli TaxID=3119538 RepID=A0AAW9Q5D1_9BURK
MNAAGLAWRRIVRRPAATLLNVLLLALGVASIAATMLALGQATRAAERNAAAADLVVGSRTSPAQLVLSGIFHLDAPPPPFALSLLQPVLAHRLVERWVPVALGDSLAGHRVVGTRPADFAGLYGGVLAAGAWPQGAGQAVLGADAARRTGLAVGAGFATTHGLAEAGEPHHGHGYRVAGVLARTGTLLDKLVLVSLESIWQAHAAPPSPPAFAARAGDPTGQVSGVLIRFRSPLAAAVLPRLVASVPTLVSASPAHEAAKLFALVQWGSDGAAMLGGLLLVCAALAVGAGLMASHRERMRDVAVLRLLGASPRITATAVLLEATFVGLLGAAAGLLAAHAAVEFAGSRLPVSAPPLSGRVFDPLELVIVAAALAVSWIGAALPAWRVQRAAVADALRME